VRKNLPGLRVHGSGNRDMRLANVVVLAGLPISSDRRYALATRLITLASDLGREGLSVLLVGPDGYWPDPAGLVDSTRPATVRNGPPDDGQEQAQSIGLITSFRVFLRVLSLSRTRLSAEPTIVVAGGIWLPFFVRLLVILRDETRLHLDIAGIPHQEVALSKPRLWRLKVPAYDWLFRKEVGWADVVTTINEAHASYVQRHYGKRPIVVPDLLATKWLNRLLTIRPPKEKNAVNILYVGSLFASRLNRFFTALEMLDANVRPDVVVVGDGPDLKSFKERATALGVIFPGYEGGEALAQRLAQADICYSDVWSEIGTPFKLLEYMAAGRAVLADDTPSTRELITNGENGLLCSRDPPDMAHALSSLVRNPDLRTELGERARKRIESLHSTDRTAPLMDAYRLLVSKG
jgi:glycosyltransferase involved in cell wall biosynthesis